MTGFVFLPSYFEALRPLPDDLRLSLYDAVLDYAFTGQEPEGLSPVANGFFRLLQPNIDNSLKRYEAAVENGKKGGRPPKPNVNPEETQTKPNVNLEKEKEKEKETETESDREREYSEPLAAAPLAPDKPKARRFIPPTVEEVAEYVQSRSSPVDPQGFIDYYESKGWTVGKSPMTDWKAACRAAEKWERWQTNGSATPTTQARATVKSFTDIAAELEAELRGEAFESSPESH